MMGLRYYPAYICLLKRRIRYIVRRYIPRKNRVILPYSAIKF